jgi:opacity protein-like surface antigen
LDDISKGSKLKNFLIAASLLATAFISTSAMAQAYVSADIGAGHTSASCAGADSCSNNGTSFKITGGYKLGSGFAGELGYIDFGKAKAATGGISGDITAKAWTIGLAYDYQVTSAFAGVARVGVASLDTKVSATEVNVGSGSESKTKAEAYYGLGANYAVAKNVKLEAGADWSHANFDGVSAVVRTISAGVRYDF